MKGSRKQEKTDVETKKVKETVRSKLQKGRDKDKKSTGERYKLESLI